MIKKMTQGVAFFFLSISVMISSSGCVPLMVGAAAGAGGYAYFRGVLSVSLTGSVEEVHDATLMVFNEKDVFPLVEELDQHRSKVVGEFKNFDKVTVTTEALTEKLTKINIRFGLFGHREKSIHLLEAIQSYL